jgi:hypothetical protein
MGLVQIIPIKKVYTDKGKGNQFYPETHVNAVVDDNGTSLFTTLNRLQEQIDDLYNEIHNLNSSEGTE